MKGLGRKAVPAAWSGSSAMKDLTIQGLADFDQDLALQAFLMFRRVLSLRFEESSSFGLCEIDS
jgi:hypothetical protein